jgi:hypothetical protein
MGASDARHSLRPCVEGRRHCKTWARSCRENAKARLVVIARLGV